MSNRSSAAYAGALNPRRPAGARGVPSELMMPRLMLGVSTLILVLIGIVMVFSASMVEAISNDESVYSYVAKQAAFAAVGAVLALITSRIPYEVWRGKGFWIVWIIGCALLVAVPLIGTEINGAKRWIYIGSFSMQPTEFVKIVLIMGAAKVMCDWRDGTLKTWMAGVEAVVCVLVPLGFMYLTQSDMGSALVIAVGILVVMLLGEFPLRPLLVVLVGGVIVVAAGLLVGYRADRIAVWLNPWSDPYGDGWQIIRSFYAFAEGGIFGVGLGNSREKYLYLPEAETDFIFSIIGEELGLIGALAVIVLFLVFLFAGLRIAHCSPDYFGRTLAGGLVSMIVFQAFLNMMCATGLFPTTGKPLPFISSGGSSLIASLIMVGVIMAVSRGSDVPSEAELRRGELNVIRVEHVSSDYAHDSARSRTGGTSSAAGSRRSSRTQGSSRRQQADDTRSSGRSRR